MPFLLLSVDVLYCFFVPYFDGFVGKEGNYCCFDDECSDVGVKKNRGIEA